MERSVRAILRAETGQYEQAMGRAASATERVGTAAQESARQTERSTQQSTTSARSFSQRLVSSARENERAWTQVGGALAIVGGATTGLMAVVANTGIGYNNLRQTATQGLIAVTGSTEAAAEQMRKLDEYGQNSWLMRDSLIRAQQQMTGFGIETEKVIPYLDALAEGVAATGGSSQTFEELAFTMSKVAGQGKITAQELNEFGQRGVDAATIIGEAMGKTGGQIRDDITDGALDAEAALDALAAGLVARYEGSSDLVRQTFRGAVDDIAAAFRDLSAIAMAPLVDPEGGGLFVTLLNQASDLLFMLRDHLPPEVLQAGGIIAGLGGFATVAAGGFMVLAPRLVETWDALGNLGRVGGAAQSSLRWIGRNAVPIAAGVTIAAGAFALWAQNAREAEARTSRLQSTLDEFGRVTTNTTDELNRAFTETAERLGVFTMDSVFDEAERIGIAFEDLTGYVLGNADAIDRVNAASEEYISGSSLWEHFGQVRQGSVANLTYQLDEWASSLTEAEKRELQLATASEETSGELDGMADSTDSAAEAVAWLEENMGSATDAIEAQEEALQELIETVNAHYDAILSERGALRALEDAFDTATETIAENGRTLDTTTEKGRANEAALDGIASAAHTTAQRMRDLDRPTAEIADVMDRARERFIEAAVAAGETEESAADLADELGLLPREVFIQVEADMQAEAQIAAFRERWDGVNIGTAWIRIAARDDLTRGQAAAGARYTAAAQRYYDRGYAEGGPIIGRASGGRIHGPGTTTSDSIPAIGPSGVRYRLSNDEHIWTAHETKMVGGHAAVESLRALASTGKLRAALEGPGYATGGGVGPTYRYQALPATPPATGSGGVSVGDLDYVARQIAREMRIASNSAGSWATRTATSYADQALQDQVVVRP